MAVAVIPPICEELFFRGYLMHRFAALGAPLAIGLQALLFTVFHLDLYGLVVYLVIGVVLGILRVWSGSIWPAVALHAVNNALGVVEIDRGVTVYEQLGIPAIVVACGLLAVGARWVRPRPG